MKAVRVRRGFPAAPYIVAGFVAIALMILHLAWQAPPSSEPIVTTVVSNSEPPHIDDVVHQVATEHLQEVKVEPKHIEEFAEPGSKVTIQNALFSKSSEAIPVQLFFHRLISTNKSSQLTCALPLSMIQESLQKMAHIWRSQANIELIFDESVPAQPVSAQMDMDYAKHIAKFSVRNVGSPAAVSNDIARILKHHGLNMWTQKNGIHVYCIGAFVGNNAVTEDQTIFIRTISYRKEELEMDLPRFTRVLAHEVGHALNLRHPKLPFCLHSCVLNQCNLMCQQKVFPPTRDARYALSLTLLQIAIARDKAARLDTLASPLRPNQRLEGVATERMGDGKALQIPLIFFPRPIKRQFLASNLRLRFNKFNPGRIALVAARLDPSIEPTKGGFGPLRIRLLATGFLNDIQGTMSPVDEEEATAQEALKDRRLDHDVAAGRFSVSTISFPDFHPTWWTEKRHMEGTIEPPVLIREGEIWGLWFSTPHVAVALVKDGLGSFGIPPAWKAGRKGGVPSFDSLMNNGTLVLPQLELFRTLTPLMNLVGE